MHFIGVCPRSKKAGRKSWIHADQHILHIEEEWSTP